MDNFTIPHEIYIKHLFFTGMSRQAVEQHLTDNDLIVPAQKTLSDIEISCRRERPVEDPVSLLEIDDREAYKPDRLTKKAIELLTHSNREIIDSLCILYPGKYKKISDELKDFDIVISANTLEKYQELFWNLSVVGTRVKWKKYVRLLPDEDKKLMNLARAGERDLLFWKLGKPKKFTLSKETIEKAMELAYMKIMETKYMTGDEIDISKIGANWISQFINLANKYQDLEVQSQFPEFVKMLEEGIIMNPEPIKHMNILDIMPQEEEEDKKKIADVIPLNQNAKKK